MDANVTIDTGKNITTLIEKLASQIGVTAKEVFPWYVNQSIIEGYTFFGMLIGFTLISFGLFIFGYYKTNKFNDDNWGILPVIAGGIILFCCLLEGSLETSSAISQIYNPNYHAMKNITYDISQMIK